MAEQVAKISFSIKEVQERLIAFVDGHVNSNISQYIEVKQGQELARFELVPPADEKGDSKKPELDNSGEDNTGDEQAGEGVDAIDDEEVILPEVFRINDEVELVQQSKLVYAYVSLRTGLAYFSPTEIKVLPEAIVNGDVGPLTGNISYTGNLTIQGYVLVGQAVECGGNLTITKGIEDRVEIKCGGNLDVAWGIHGINTTVTCTSDCTIGHVEKSEIICDGNVDIKGYALLAQIFSHGYINVQGVGLKSSGQGSAIMGGQLNALESITARSSGTEACVTTLVAGIDTRVKIQLDKAYRLHALFEKRQLVTQKEIEMYISAAGSAEKLGKMSSELKKEVRVKLQAMKEEQKSMAALKESISKLEASLYPKTVNKSFICFEESAEAVIKLTIKDQQYSIEKRIAGTSRFRLGEDEIKRVV